ncbi:aminotransferase class I/II-fold pyridoxal phosphate-dependent enzyme [Paenibacillus sp.]|uniref:aminotransferase class I/II-fold pyridoxal phosphate-dependent enzyme n=1 Tax=Paenibacillus sp. TaxID=58172 RepID=UPI002D4BD3C3|nr:aminotransferase class I/II-fold pyridoxal phosphate-dependent enzyme [Paenibacillus sp.]HZG55829.1 aminotransferase class I/II-fold pyridoxal phosphate-dependent enzyme [Paenibacillus sp.]
MERSDRRPHGAEAPLVEALWEYTRRRRAGFHVPGHKAGAAYANGDAPDWLSAVGVVDATELPGLDDLHAPMGAIEAAQTLAAACFGADRTFFLVGGSTAGNLAAIQAAVAPGELVVMQRDVHKSAIHALMLRGAGAVFVAPRTDAATGLPGAVEAAAIARALDEHPEARAVFVTRPNYYGIAGELREIADVAHARNVPLIVDEAHGAHFGRHPRFPASALACGADVVVQSTHKMLPALTMGAMLHVRGNRLPADRIGAFLHMLQSSSPSYPILASLDWARRELQARGSELFDPALQAIDRWRAEGREGAFARFETSVAEDPLKLLLRDREGTLSGYELLAQLAERGVYTEMANERYALLACSAATSYEELERLRAALYEIALRFPAKKKENPQNFANSIALGTNSVSKPVFFSAYGANANAESEVTAVPLERAEGEISAEMIVPYPPGIPALYPGERVEGETVAALLQLRAYGAAVQGAKDRELRTVLVRRRNPSSG